jgi:hypothetical protein
MCVPLLCCAGPTADEPDSSMQTLRDTYYFLQENGYINFGVVKGTQTRNGSSPAAQRKSHTPVTACCLVSSGFPLS